MIVKKNTLIMALLAGAVTVVVALQPKADMDENHAFAIFMRYNNVALLSAVAETDFVTAPSAWRAQQRGTVL